MSDLINCNKTSFFLAIGATPPTPPTGAIETTEPVVITPEFQTIDIKRITGQMNAGTSVVDLCRTKTSFDVNHIMRASNIAATALGTPPQYGLLLQSAGFLETIDSGTAGSETVTYVNGVDTMPISSAVGYLDGLKTTLTNTLASGTTISLKVGTPAEITNNFSGYMDEAEPIAEAMPTVPKNMEPPLVVSCADVVTFDGDCLPLENVTIKLNEEMQDIYTLGGACGIKQNIITDYALELTADFYVGKTTFGREINSIKTGDMKEIIVKIALDKNSTEINGKSVVFTVKLAKTITYSDTVDKDLLKRTVTYRLMDGTEPALSIKTGFFA